LQPAVDQAYEAQTDGIRTISTAGRSILCHARRGAYIAVERGNRLLERLSRQEGRRVKPPSRTMSVAKAARPPSTMSNRSAVARIFCRRGPRRVVRGHRGKNKSAQAFCIRPRERPCNVERRWGYSSGIEREHCGRNSVALGQPQGGDPRRLIGAMVPARPKKISIADGFRQPRQTALGLGTPRQRPWTSRTI